jgi:hypothetical protein
VLSVVPAVRQGHNIISANAHLRYLNGHIGVSLG